MIIIRRATKDEVSDLQNLNDEIFMDNAQYDSDLDLTWAQGAKGKEYFTQLVNNPEALCLFAENEGKKIGYLAASPKIIDYRNSRYFEIENMGVTPEYRSKGIGKMLMQECFAWAKSKGFQKAFVTSYSKNIGAVDFYKKNGFEEIDISLEKDL
jgi:ribosomal protein S18 acetylase RimI-like enzyme